MSEWSSGFTETDDIRQILAPYEEVMPLADLVRFQGLPALDARRLLDLLPSWQRDQRQNFSPTFGEFLQLAERFPALTYSGYRIRPVREDERITVEAFECGGLNAAEARALEASVSDADDLLVDSGPDDTWTLRAWWS